MNKEAIEKLLEKAQEHLERFGGSSSHCHDYIAQALAILKEQPPASDFTKEARKYIDWSPCMSEGTCKGYAERLKQACKIIDSDKASRKDLVDALRLLTKCMQNTCDSCSMDCKDGENIPILKAEAAIAKAKKPNLKGT